MRVSGVVWRIIHDGSFYPDYLVANDNEDDARTKFREHNITAEILLVDRVGFGSILMEEVDER